MEQKDVAALVPPGRCNKGLHGPEDMTVFTQVRGDRIVRVIRCNGCRKKKPNHGAVQQDFHESRKLFAVPKGDAHEHGTLWEIRLNPCQHYLLFKGLHLPRHHSTPVYCFRCRQERTILFLEQWDPEVPRVGAR